MNASHCEPADVHAPGEFRPDPDDTIATAPEGELFMSHPKTWAIPHVDDAAAITDVASFGAKWNEFPRCFLIVRDIDMVDQVAPGVASTGAPVVGKTYGGMRCGGSEWQVRRYRKGRQ